MNPYYEAAGVTIYHGDCFDVIPQVLPSLVWAESVLLTDPPYGIDGGKGGDSKDFGKGNYESLSWSDTREWLEDTCVPVLSSLIQKCQRGAITPGIRNIDLYPRPADMGCFWTPAAATHGPWGFTTMQPILYYGKDFRAGKGALPSGLQVTEQAPRLGHPCAKPEGAWSWLFKKVAESTDVVIDPFMGSGTTAIVGKRMGNRVVCIEIEERFCEIAARRLECDMPLLEIG